MGLYQYGVGGNEVKVDANESIAEIPSNCTVLSSNIAIFICARQTQRVWRFCFFREPH